MSSDEVNLSRTCFVSGCRTGYASDKKNKRAAGQVYPRAFSKHLKNTTWWKKRTSMERSLTLTIAVSFIAGISLIIALARVLHTGNKVVSNEQNAKPRVCLTPGCIHTASRVLEYIDQSVDPCDDFYDFACGNFVKKTSIPDAKSSVSSFSIISDKVQEQLRSMIEEPIQPKELRPFQLAKKLYRACMNTALIEADGLKTIKEILVELGGWPVIKGAQWYEGDFDWRKSVYKLEKNGYNADYLIYLSISTDMRNPKERIIDIDQAYFGLSREFLTKGLEDKLVKAYYDYMVDIAVIFGANKERAAKELGESLEFEIKLANISLPKEKRRNLTALYNTMTVEEVQQKFPSIPWIEYINTVLDPVTQVSKNEIIVVSVPKYISEFEALIARTPKRVLANYMLWRAIEDSVNYLNDELKNRRLAYISIITGKRERAFRWKECIDISTSGMSIATGALYIRKYFKEEAKRRAKEIVVDIKEGFEYIWKKVDWIDMKSRQNALDKAKSMHIHIAYPDELLNDTKLEEFYGDLEFDENRYLRSVGNFTLFIRRLNFKRLRQPVNKTDWITHARPTEVNAFSSAAENSVQLPAGILQGIFFSSDRLRYMNYGAIGFVIAREIIQGFDDIGRQFDKEGNLTDWWQPETDKAFVEKVQCIVDQYSKFKVPELKLSLNGMQTQEENMADMGGIKGAYFAYRKWVERNGEEPQLPGVKYSGRQMFWISAASIWCSVTRDALLRQEIITSVQAPHKFRVVVPLSDMENFAKDFNCPKGSRMNPVQKCGAWGARSTKHVALNAILFYLRGG